MSISFSQIAADVKAFFAHFSSISAAVAKVLTEADEFAPQFTSELSTLVQDAEAIALALAPAIAAKGTNPALDAAAIAPATKDIEKLVSDVTSFLPVLKAELAKLEAAAK